MNNHFIKGTENRYQMMIDSGTTFTYFPESLFNLIKVHFEWFCGMDPEHNCKGKMDFTERGYLCWHYDPTLFNDKPIGFFLSLPILRFAFNTVEGSTYQYDWYPSEYLYMDEGSKYCVAADI